MVTEMHCLLLWGTGFLEELSWVGLPILWLTLEEAPSVGRSCTFFGQNWEGLQSNSAEIGN